MFKEAGISRDAEFEEFFQRHYSSLVGSLTVAFGDAEAAAEAVQDGFQRAYVRWMRIRRYDRPEAWVRKVALNRMRDAHRTAQRREKVENRLAREPIKQPLDRRLSGSLEAAVEALPQQQRLAVILFYVHDLPVVAVAAEMGISEGSVKSYLHAARSALRSSMSASSTAQLSRAGGSEGAP